MLVKKDDLSNIKVLEINDSENCINSNYNVFDFFVVFI